MGQSQGKRDSWQAIEHYRSTLASLAHYRRWSNAGVAALGSAIFLISWCYRDPADVFIAWGYPVFGAIFAGLAWWTLRGRSRLVLIDRVLVGLAAVIILGRLAWHYLVGDPLGANLMPLVGGHYWAVGLLIVGSFLLLGFQGGAIVGGLSLGLSVLLASSVVVPCIDVDSTRCDNLVYLARIHLFLLVFVVLSSTAVLLRDRTRDVVAKLGVLEEVARTDHLSGLSNRRAGEAFLATQFELNRRYGHPLSVILIDLDNFKRINDAYGHPAGDSVIVALADMLRREARDVDMAVRWGGDEFLVICPETGREDALRTAARFHSLITADCLGGFDVTATLGVAELQWGDRPEDLIQRVDEQLYRGKEAGRNTVRLGGDRGDAVAESSQSAP
ncbi:diguanylate cyclase (GGDEF)-like protein [Tamilnaduibacter salinus]|uniref:diguanylate cyclase n=1 Tax=Tamilnaduibacter salinus TaxID=1484056 RepID=A0A2U1D1K2_9GAMM|nr:GGDEF domain-containing protein [Tamilnaduibacter salinus]PVY79188.1 diguanylate cyclase (GGDEF)-like protein [Tamilnaduibacter salinus]